MTAKELGRLGAALLIGAGLAFPAGWMVAGLSNRPATPAHSGPAGVADVFSPALRSDPWFIEKQREGYEALERECRRTGEYCAEAREARRLLTELEHGP